MFKTKSNLIYLYFCLCIPHISMSYYDDTNKRVPNYAQDDEH